MATNVLIPFYSAYGHTFQMAQAVEEGAEGVTVDGDGTDVRVRRVAELESAREAMNGQDAYQQAQEQMTSIEEVSHDDLRWADGIVWGTPTRYGNVSSKLKNEIDKLSAL
jgi:NAD(P)H dehydrogenase (quinone)